MCTARFVDSVCREVDITNLRESLKDENAHENRSCWCKEVDITNLCESRKD